MCAGPGRPPGRGQKRVGISDRPLPPSRRSGLSPYPATRPRPINNCCINPPFWRHAAPQLAWWCAARRTELGQTSGRWRQVSAGRPDLREGGKSGLVLATDRCPLPGGLACHPTPSPAPAPSTTIASTHAFDNTRHHNWPGGVRPGERSWGRPPGGGAWSARGRADLREGGKSGLVLATDRCPLPGGLACHPTPPPAPALLTTAASTLAFGAGAPPVFVGGG